MQRFQCLFEANHQSARAFRQLRCYGQRSNFSNFATLPRRAAILSGANPTNQSQISRLPIITSIPASRFYSNNTAPLPDSNSPIAPPPTDEFVPTDSPLSVDPYASETIYNVEPHIGYLKELGLDYGIGTTTLVQDAMEYAYIYGGYSWGTTIIGVVLAFRIAMFKFAVDAADMGARLRASKGITKDVDARLKEATYNKDVMARQLAIQEKRAIYNVAGIKMRKIFISMAINVPIGFGTFRIMRGMASLPVPGFENGGILWLQDLSVPDPYFITPFVTAFVIYNSFKFMQQSGEVGEGEKSTQILFRWVLPALTLIIGVNFPGCLQLTMLTTAVTQGAQQWLFAQPSFRRSLNMHPLPEKKVEVPKVLNVKGRVIQQAGPAKPDGLVPRLKWHLSRVAKETQETSEKMFPGAAKPPEKKKGSKRR